MKKTIFSLSVVLLSAATLAAQTIEDVVATHIAASGGATKLKNIKTVAMESVVKVQGLEIENYTVIQVGKAIRSDSKIMGNDMVQAYDGTTAWAITPIMMGGSGEPQLMPAELAKSFITQVDLFPLLDYAAKGTKLELLPNEKVKEKEAYHLKIIPKAGEASEVWIDVTNGLMVKLKTMQNGQEVEMFFSTYTTVEEVKFATGMEITNPMAGIVMVETTSVKINMPLDELIFKIPNKKN